MTDSAEYDRIRIDYTSDVPLVARSEIAESIQEIATANHLYCYEHYDKAFSGWSIDIAAHDRTRTVDLTDGQIVELLSQTANERGITMGDLLRGRESTELCED